LGSIFEDHGRLPLACIRIKKKSALPRVLGGNDERKMNKGHFMAEVDAGFSV